MNFFTAVLFSPSIDMLRNKMEYWIEIHVTFNLPVPFALLGLRRVLTSLVITRLTYRPRWCVTDSMLCHRYICTRPASNNGNIWKTLFCNVLMQASVKWKQHNPDLEKGCVGLDSINLKITSRCILTRIWLRVKKSTIRFHLGLFLAITRSIRCVREFIFGVNDLPLFNELWNADTV